MRIRCTTILARQNGQNTSLTWQDAPQNGQSRSLPPSWTCAPPLMEKPPSSVRSTPRERPSAAKPVWRPQYGQMGTQSAAGLPQPGQRKTRWVCIDRRSRLRAPERNTQQSGSAAELRRTKVNQHWSAVPRSPGTMRSRTVKSSMPARCAMPSPSLDVDCTGRWS